MDSPAALYDTLLAGMERHAEQAPGDEIENCYADPAWWADLERYCYLTGEEEGEVVPELRGAALAKLERRARG